LAFGLVAVGTETSGRTGLSPDPARYSRDRIRTPPCRRRSVQLRTRSVVLRFDLLGISRPRRQKIWPAAYGRICQQRAKHGGDAMLAAVHHSREVQQPERQLRDLLANLIAEAAAGAMVRSDVPAAELASFCVHALTAAADIGSPARVQTLVDLLWASLTPASSS
jgi:hypothetical protein